MRGRKRSSWKPSDAGSELAVVGDLGILLYPVDVSTAHRTAPAGAKSEL
jgi:hypothetical protein